MRVFLGGTCGGSTWRNQIIPMLEKAGINYFDPVVSDWTPDCKAEELRQRKICDVLLYVITPKMKGVYSIAEVVQDSCFSPEKTVMVLLEDDGGLVFDEGQLRSLTAVAEMVDRNGSNVFYDLESAVYVMELIQKSQKRV